MQLKSYFAATVEAAMMLAGKELGGDALLVHARPTTPETRYLGAYEVVFGLTNPSGEPDTGAQAEPGLKAEQAMATAAGSGSQASVLRMTTAAQPTQAHGPIQEDSSGFLWERRLHGLRQEIGQLRQAALSQSLVPPRQSPSGIQFKQEDSYLPQARPEANTRPGQRVSVDSELPAPKLPDQSIPDGKMRDGKLPVTAERTSRRIIALVGPPGAGKSTTLAKLAVHCGLMEQKRVRLLTTAVHGLGAADQLQVLSAILGVECVVVETAAALQQALTFASGTLAATEGPSGKKTLTDEEREGPELVLIDTPGYTPRNMSAGLSFALVLAANPEVDTHLVLPAAMEPSVMAATLNQFALFRPSKILFSRMDELDHHPDLRAALASLAREAGLPVDFVTTGPAIPDDLQEIEPTALSSWLPFDVATAAESMPTEAMLHRASRGAGA